jgi:hypothetical protein
MSAAVNEGYAALADLFESEGRRIARSAYGRDGICRADIATAADCFAVAAAFRSASGMSASGQDREAGLEAKPASPAPHSGETPENSPPKGGDL